MKNSRSSYFFWGMVVLALGVSLFLLNYQLWFTDFFFWTSIGVSLLGAFLLGMSANNNKAGEYRLFEDMPQGSVFQIGMFRQEKEEIHMLIRCEDKWKFYYTSESVSKFLNEPEKGVWYVYRNNKIYRDLTRSPLPVQESSSATS